MKTLNKLTHYMGNRKKLFPVAIILSAVSELAGIAPLHTDMAYNARTACRFAGASQRQHRGIRPVDRHCRRGQRGALFRLACMFASRGLPRGDQHPQGVHSQVVAMPLGFFDTTTSGRIRKVIDDNAGVTHSFVAHQMPDLA